jgi:hypothetical protein
MIDTISRDNPASLSTRELEDLELATRVLSGETQAPAEDADSSQD